MCREFDDLWSQRSFSQKCEVYAEKVLKEYHSWFMNWKTLKWQAQMTCQNSKKFPPNVKFLNFFFGHSMTSLSKVMFTKLLTIMWNLCIKNFIKISWIIHDLEASKFMISYWMISVFKNENFLKGHTLNKFFQTFNDLWGQRLFSQSCWQSCKMHV